jgi:hypothetical protein
VIGLLGLVGAGLGVIGATVGRMPGLDSPSGPLAPALAGATLGLAAGGVAFQFAEVDERGGGASFEQALAGGVGWATLVLAFLLAAAAVVIWRRPGPASSAARQAAES